MVLDLNIAPYYDDYDEDKNFLKILFNPSLAVQARELTQLQTILQKQIERFGNHLFKEGSQIIGLGQTVDKNFSFVKIETTYGGSDVVYTNFSDKKITGSTSGAVALVRNIGANVTDAQDNVLYIKYITTTKFAEGETLTTDDSTPFSATTSSPGDASHIGDTIAISVNSGIMFTRGYFVSIGEQTNVLEPYTTVTNKRVGFRLNESLITPNDDASLNDLASGSGNFAAPGAHRYKIGAVLDAISTTSTDDTDFIEIARFVDGNVKNQVTKTDYADIMKMISRRTFDESGNYTVRPFKISVDEHATDSTKLKIGISPGKAYVEGYELEFQATQFINIDRARTSKLKNNANIGAEYGNYVDIELLQGLFNNTKMEQLGIRDDTIANGQGDEIGTCRVRQLKKATSTAWKLYIFDVTMKKEVKTIVITAGGSGYVVGSGIDFSGDFGTIATVSATNDAVDSVTISAGGTGFVVGDVLTFSGGGGTGASATVATVSGGAITAIAVTAGGSGYSTVPTISGGSGTGETLVAVGNGTSGVFGEITGTTIANGGTGYTTAPTIVGFADDSVGTGATGTTTIGDIVFADRAKSLLIVIADSGRTYDTKADITLDTAKAVIKEQNNNTLIYSISPSPVKSFTDNETNYTLQRTIENVTVGTSSPFSFTVSLPISTDDFSSFDGLNYQVVSRETFGADGVAGDELVIASADISLDSGTNVGTFNTENAFGNQLSGKSVDIIISVFKSQDNERAKTLNTITSKTLTPESDDSVLLKDGTNTQVYDIFNGDSSLIVLDSADSADITTKYTLDDGQKDNFYDYGKLTLNTGETAPAGNVIVTFKYFTHGGTGSYFTAESYVSTIYGQISDFTSKFSGKVFKLRNCMDFRPNISDLGSGHEIPIPNNTVVFDYDYYLPRVDKVVVTKNGEFVHVAGEPEIRPLIPNDINNSMSLFQVSIPAYTFKYTDVVVKMIDNKVYTMKDIGNLEKRVNKIEYYTSLNLLEQDARDVLITDGAGLTRFKNGILVDNFNGHKISDVNDSAYSASIDVKNGLLRPLFYTANIPLKVLSTSNLKNNTNIVTLDFEKEVYIEQPLASNTVNVQEFVTVTWKGQMSLTPDSDDWFDVTQGPDVVIDFDNNAENWNTLARSVFGTTWNDWETVWSGTPQEGGTFFERGTQFSTTRTSSSQVRTRSNIVANPEEETQTNLGNRILGLSIIPFARSRSVEFSITALRPNTRFYVFVDDVDVSQFAYQTSGTEDVGGEFTLADNPIQTSANAVLDSSPTFTTTNTSNVVTVHHEAHGQTLDVQEQARHLAGDTVEFTSVASNVNGIPLAEFNAIHTIQSVVDADSYTINTTSNATSTGTMAQSGVVSIGTGTTFGTNPRIVKIIHNGHGLEDDQLVSFSGSFPSTINGITTSWINGTLDDSIFTKFHHHIHNITTNNYTITLKNEEINAGIYRTSQGLDLPQQAHNNANNAATVATSSGTGGSGGIVVNVHGGVMKSNSNGELNGVVYLPNARVGTYNGALYAGVNSYGWRKRSSETVRSGEPSFTDALSTTLRFRTGERRIIVSESLIDPLSIVASDTSYSSSIFEVSGALQEKGTAILSTRTPRISIESLSESRVVVSVDVQQVDDWDDDQGGDDDPLAQTFFVGNSGPGINRGSFITDIDVYFSTKDDDDIPIKMELREVVNGVPGVNVVPFGTKTLNISDVNISTDASLATNFAFSDPIYLKPNVEYCFVLITNSQKYRVYTAKLGKTVLGGTRLISQAPYVGSLFLSQNNRTWTADQTSDLKFTIRRANFNQTTGTIIFENKKLSSGLEDMGPPNAIGTTNNYHYNVGSLQIQDLILPKTTIAYQQKSAGVDGVIDASYSNIKNKQNFFYDTEQRLDGNTTAKKLQIQATLTRPSTSAGTDEYISPVIDKGRTSFIVVGNRIDATSPKSVYVSKTVKLEDASDTLKVYLTSYIPSTATVSVYYKAATANQDISTQDWQLMDLSNTRISPLETTSTASDEEVFKEYEYDPTTNPPDEDFVSFKMKIEMTSTNTSLVPKIKDMRAIAVV